MKTFKASKWDSDAEQEAPYQDLFKETTINKKKDRSKPFQDDDQKKLRKLKKQIRDIKNNDLNVITVQTKIQLSQSQNIANSSESKNKVLRKKCKKSKAEVANDSEDSETEVTKKQRKMLKKYSSELNTLHSHSDVLSKELLKEKKRQKKLKKKLEKASKQKLSLGQIFQEKGRDGSDSLKIRKIKKEPNDSQDIFNSDVSTRKKKKREKELAVTEMNAPTSLKIAKRLALQEKLKTILNQVEKREQKPIITLRQKMMEKLKAARFRFLNEQIYTTDSKEAQKIFKSDPEAFLAYHEGYRQQVKSWPLNPLSLIVKAVKKMPKTHVIADFGCGDAKLAKTVEQKVHSFDLVAINDSVTACDMSNVPLPDASVDVVVFCLSLMGTNLRDYLIEANRVLKLGGILKIAEVESRFEDVNNFIEGVQHFGFKKIWKDLSHNLFYFMDFKKVINVKNKKKLPTISLLPCLYKKR